MSRMKIKPTTFFLVLAALLLGGVVVMVQSQPSPKQADAAKAGEELYGFQEKQVKSFTLQTGDRTLEFERDRAGKWQMVKPEKTLASDPSVAFLLDLLATGKSDRTVTVPAKDQAQYGFDQPLATVNVKLDNQETHKLILGGYDFNRSFIYAQVDPPTPAPSDLKLHLVAPSFEGAVKRPLAEWKQSNQPGKQAAEGSKAQPDASSPEASPKASESGTSPLPSPPAEPGTLPSPGSP